MKRHDNIKHFLHSVRDRLNKALLFRTVQWSFLATGIALMVISTVFIICGRHVPIWIYFTGLLCTAIAIVCVWAIKRYDLDGAGHFADNFFKLHDGVVSFSKFESQGKQGGFFDLQADQVEDTVNHSDNPQHIPLGLSKRVCTIALALMIAALSMGFFDDSDAVKQKRLLQEVTLSRSKQVNSELKKELEDVLKHLEKEQDQDADAKKQLSELKKLVKDLKVTEDQKKAMSQYAKLERELQKMLSSTKQRKDELLLDRVGDKLKSIRDGKQLGKKLSQKDYKAAAEELEKLKLKLKLDKMKSKEEKKKLAKLKNISQQMATAAESSLSKKAQSGKQNSPENPSQKSESKKSLAQKMAELNEAVENQQKSQCESGCKNANSEISELSKALSKLANKRSMQQAMKSLSQKLSQSQKLMACKPGKGKKPGMGKMPGMGDKPGMGSKPEMGKVPGMGTKPGGLQAGDGSVDSRTDKKTPDSDNGNIQSMEGIKGQGPSDVTTEEANSGTGSVSGAVAKRKLQYRKQAEAYIQRQDVPSEVKQGVKHYFENIHQADK
jgi:hypothetical protein